MTGPAARVRAGVPSGGQFAASTRPEATVVLVATARDTVPVRTLAEAIEFAGGYCSAAGGARPGMCHTAAWNVREEFGWPIVEGVREGRPHSWNAMPDGRWFDPTAAQFGDDGPCVIDAGDCRYVLRAP